jgi:hypothetical protein
LRRLKRAVDHVAESRRTIGELLKGVLDEVMGS